MLLERVITKLGRQFVHLGNDVITHETKQTERSLGSIGNNCQLLKARAQVLESNHAPLCDFVRGSTHGETVVCNRALLAVKRGSGWASLLALDVLLDGHVRC